MCMLCAYNQARIQAHSCDPSGCGQVAIFAAVDTGSGLREGKAANGIGASEKECIYHVLKTIIV